ncbi:unnamed protein product [Prorocentrum cordatum]|uniref:Uncharacterized protein n=1 Tax=Prorocentrum cordatum TaxID=2364126 RepID=A0ABN9RR75_9DINO|nr:unnamed protein product [Polarella glacialis]
MLVRLLLVKLVLVRLEKCGVVVLVMLLMVPEVVLVWERVAAVVVCAVVEEVMLLVVTVPVDAVVVLVVLLRVAVLVVNVADVTLVVLVPVVRVVRLLMVEVMLLLVEPLVWEEVLDAVKLVNEEAPVVVNVEVTVVVMVLVMVVVVLVAVVAVSGVSLNGVSLLVAVLLVRVVVVVVLVMVAVVSVVVLVAVVLVRVVVLVMVTVVRVVVLVAVVLIRVVVLVMVSVGSGAGHGGSGQCSSAGCRGARQGSGAGHGVNGQGQSAGHGAGHRASTRHGCAGKEPPALLRLGGDLCPPGASYGNDCQGVVADHGVRGLNCTSTTANTASLHSRMACAPQIRGIADDGMAIHDLISRCRAQVRVVVAMKPSTIGPICGVVCTALRLMTARLMYHHRQKKRSEHPVHAAM